MAFQILIVDDHPLVRKGMKSLIKSEKNFEICGEAGNSAEALKLVNEKMPDIVTVDLSLEGETSGLDLIKKLTEHFPGVKTLVISMHDESIFAQRALQAGARGYIMKKEAQENIVLAMHKILSGGVFLSQNISNSMIRNIVDKSASKSGNPIDILGNKEFEVFQLIGQGFFSAKEIAQKMNISKHTVDSHKRHIKEKLNLKSSRELSRFALQWSNTNKF